MKNKFKFLALAIMALLSVNVWGADYTGSLEITISNFTEITTSYTKQYTHEYTINKSATETQKCTIEAYGVYKNSNGIQMNSGKGTYIKNTSAFPGYITSIECTWTATGKNSPTLYVNKGSVASTSSTSLGKGSNTTTTQTYTVTNASTSNCNYFYFDGTTVTGACYLSKLKINYTVAAATPVTSLDLYVAGQHSDLKSGKNVGDKYTLPTPAEVTAECGTKSLAGWSTSEIPSPTTKPTSGFYAPGAEVTLEANNTFYAVFADKTGDETEYVRITDLNELQDGMSIVVVADNGSKLLKNNVSAANAPTESSSKIKVTPSTDVWTLNASSTKWQLCNSSGALGATSTNNGTEVSITSSNNTWTIGKSSSGTNNFYFNVTGTVCLEYYSSQSKWVVYGNNSYTSSNYFTMRLYKANVSYSNYTTTCVSCTNKITITKGTPYHGSFTLTGAGTDICADEPVTVSLSNITADAHYHATAVTSSNGGSPSAITDGSASVTGITASTTINVTFAEDTKVTVTLLNNNAPVNAGGFDAQGKKEYYTGETLGTLPTLTSSEACDETSNTFMGWTSDTGFQKRAAAPSFVTSTTTVTGNMTLRAVWARAE